MPVIILQPRSLRLHHCLARRRAVRLLGVKGRLFRHHLTQVSAEQPAGDGSHVRQSIRIVGGRRQHRQRQPPNAGPIAHEHS